MKFLLFNNNEKVAEEPTLLAATLKAKILIQKNPDQQYDLVILREPQDKEQEILITFKKSNNE